VKPGPHLVTGGWAFEPKWDGFCAIVRGGSAYTVRSRRGWHMNELLRAGAFVRVQSRPRHRSTKPNRGGIPRHERRI
jgi:ATP-dependent DNA ligase